MPKDLEIPVFGIQADWEDALGSSSGGKCWISLRKIGEDKSMQGELNRSSGNSDTVGNDSFRVAKERSGGRYLTVQETKTGQECVFVGTGSTLNGIHKAGVISMDISEGGLGVSLCKNNELKVWETDTGNVRRSLQGHPIDAYTCRFFPSGIVILTGGTDCCLKIWSAETGECPATLRGHGAAILDCSIVDRGRNIVSVSKDGTARLWDCGQGKCLGTLLSCGSTINSCMIMSPSNYDLGKPIPHMSDREVSTSGKLLVVGREDSKVTGISIAARNTVFNCSLPSPVNKVAAIGNNAFVAGCEGGQIVVFQLHHLNEPQKITLSTSSPILDLMVHPSLNKTTDSLSPFWASKADGTTILINPNVQPCSKVIQLTGPDCDAVYQIKSDLDFIYTACRDRLIRKYSLKVINRFM